MLWRSPGPEDPERELVAEAIKSAARGGDVQA